MIKIEILAEVMEEEGVIEVEIRMERGEEPSDIIKIQRRSEKRPQWVDVGETEYRLGDVKFVDSFVSKNQIYQYRAFPVSFQDDGVTLLSSNSGMDTLSTPLKMDFDGVFISNNTESYQMLYNLEYGAIEHNIESALFTPVSTKYPVVATSKLDYTKFNVSALMLSSEVEEMLGFLKDGKPKIYKDSRGKTKMVALIDNPSEEPHPYKEELVSLSVSFVEVGDANDSILLASNFNEKTAEVI